MSQKKQTEKVVLVVETESEQLLVHQFLQELESNHARSLFLLVLILISNL
jgi:hypothetical protein